MIRGRAAVTTTVCSYSFPYTSCLLIVHESPPFVLKRRKFYLFVLFLLCHAFSVANSIIKRLKLLWNEILSVDFSSLTAMTRIYQKTTYKIQLFVFTVWRKNAIEFSIKTPNCRNTQTFNIRVYLWECL